MCGIGGVLYKNATGKVGAVLERLSTEFAIVEKIPAALPFLALKKRLASTLYC